MTQVQNDFVLKPRLRASAEIKLLRLSLLPNEGGVCEHIGSDWSPAHPTESLSPEIAAKLLSTSPWELSSVVIKRYQTLQRRYPPEQFSARHLEWRPASELLQNPKARLNWFWQSGLMPPVVPVDKSSENVQCNDDSSEFDLTPKSVLQFLCSRNINDGKRSPAP